MLLCDSGAEDACAAEASRSLVVKEQGMSYVLADAPDERTAMRAVYHAQTITHACLFLGKCDGAPDERIARELVATPIPVEGRSFAVRSHSPEHLGTGTQRLNELFGGPIKDATGLPVDLETPELIFVPFTNGSKTLLGLSLAKTDLRKRDYKVFSSNKSLRSTIAAAILFLSGYTGKERFLLPYEDDGTLAIEAALFATRTSPYKYSKQFSLFWPWLSELFEQEDTDLAKAEIAVCTPSVQFLKAVQKNAKIAGILPSLKLMKAELDWLDTKFDEQCVDIMLAQLPNSSKHRDEKEVKKIADDLAYEANYVLVDGGTLGILCLRPDELLPSFTKHRFTEVRRHALWMGAQQISLMILRKEMRAQKEKST